MKFLIVVIIPVILLQGCGNVELKKHNNYGSEKISAYLKYSPEEVKILPLTEVTELYGRPEIEAYIGLLDKHSNYMKSPAIFRFELYHYRERSADSKGSRIKKWDDIKLINPAENNKYWNDYLRAYKFDLKLDSAQEDTYILQVTCNCPNGKRLTAKKQIN